jgi:hypothetical protein
MALSRSLGQEHSSVSQSSAPKGPMRAAHLLYACSRSKAKFFQKNLPLYGTVQPEQRSPLGWVAAVASRNAKKALLFGIVQCYKLFSLNVSPSAGARSANTQQFIPQKAKRHGSREGSAVEKLNAGRIFRPPVRDAEVCKSLIEPPERVVSQRG